MEFKLEIKKFYINFSVGDLKQNHSTFLRVLYTSLNLEQTQKTQRDAELSLAEADNRTKELNVPWYKHTNVV